jgi:hypothetical protein
VKNQSVETGEELLLSNLTATLAGLRLARVTRVTRVTRVMRVMRVTRVIKHAADITHREEWIQ